MKRELSRLIYKRFKMDQIEMTETADRVLIFAKQMIRAKDEEGMDLFWDEEEEHFLRKYIEYTDALVEC